MTPDAGKPPVDAERVKSWRESITAGTVTKEDYRQVIEHLRQGRKAAAELSTIKKAQAGKRKKKSQPEPAE